MSALRILALAMMIMLATDPAATAERPSFEAACAAFDLHIVMLIEERGSIEPDSRHLVAAAHTMQQGREACRAGDWAKALHLYEIIDLRPLSRALQPFFGLH